EARARLVKRLDDFRIAIRLHREVNLHPGQILAKGLVVLAQDLVIHHKQRTSMHLGKLQQMSLVHKTLLEVMRVNLISTTLARRASEESTGQNHSSLARRATPGVVELIAVGDQEILELPGIIRVELGLVVPAEVIRVVLQRRPVMRDRNELAEV